ncbi:MAG: hypothetical protein Q9160_004714 [Pyrenula sp. 1 TL-2023]
MSFTSTTPLPPRLLNFFARYPPKSYSAKFAYPPRSALDLSHPPPPPPPPPPTSNTSSSDPNASMTEPLIPSSSLSQTAPPTHPNPFLPYRSPTTQRWRGPMISLRRQADLVKLAKAHHIEELLPPGRKSTAFKEARVLELGLRVRGTGEGQRVKGHKWERTIEAKLEARRSAMEGMPEMIRRWKQVSQVFFHFLLISGLMGDENESTSLYVC